MRAPDLICARLNAGTEHERGEHIPNSNGTDAKRARISHLKLPETPELSRSSSKKKRETPYTLGYAS